MLFFDTYIFGNLLIVLAATTVAMIAMFARATRE